MYHIMITIMDYFTKFLLLLKQIKESIMRIVSQSSIKFDGDDNS